MGKLKRVWSIVSSILVGVVVLAAALLAAARLTGVQLYTILSGSMEPTYHVGSLICVKKVAPEEVQVGDPITFVLDDTLVVATHRVIEIEQDDDGAFRYRTKGDANPTPDGEEGVHQNNLLGKPFLTIPYLGYAANYVQHPPGMYVAIAAAVVILLLGFLPGGGKKRKES